MDRYNPSSRYKDRARQKLNSFLFFVVTFVIAMLLGYWLGRQTVGATLKAQSEQISLLKVETRDLQQSLTDARTDAQTAIMRENQLKEDMETLFPSDGPLKELISQVRNRLEEGANPERLAFVIKSARPPRNCTDPETKRFIVKTPTYKGPDSTISLDDGMVVVTALGVSAKNQSGQPEAWYDPGQPVEITFEKFGGETETKKGTLPLSVSMIVKDKEYRFTFSGGARSFIKATYDSCDYP